MANIGFISLGCAKNQVDCERMMYRVQEAGHTVKEDIVGSAVVVINTCGFIDSAKTEAIDYILQTAQLKAEGLVGKILVTGCLSQRYQDEILKEMPEVDGILGTGSYTEIVPAIDSLLEEKQVVDFGSIDAPEQETGRVVTTPDHYAFIKIAEGCDNRCAYCIIPYLRGKYRSRQMDDILYEARLLADSGVKELMVVAQDTSRYGTDLPGHKRLLHHSLPPGPVSQPPAGRCALRSPDAGGQRGKGAHRSGSGHQPLRHGLPGAQAASAGTAAAAVSDRGASLDPSALCLSGRN